MAKYKRKYVLIAERALGRELPNGAIVHHVDGNRDNNRNDNLCILASTLEHLSLHRRKRIYEAGGNPFTQQICATCKQLKDLSSFSTRPNRQANGSVNPRSNECRPCTANRVHSYWRKKSGQIERYLTPEQFSEKQRKAALSGWSKRKANVSAI